MTEIIAKLLSLILLIPLKENSVNKSDINILKELKKYDDERQHENEDEDHWTDSTWYIFLVYTLGVGTGIMGVFTYQAYQYLQ